MRLRRESAPRLAAQSGRSASNQHCESQNLGWNYKQGTLRNMHPPPPPWGAVLASLLYSTLEAQAGGSLSMPHSPAVDYLLARHPRVWNPLTLQPSGYRSFLLRVRGSKACPQCISLPLLHGSERLAPCPVVPAHARPLRRPWMSTRTRCCSPAWWPVGT